jgi:protein-tyrosine phosphatase
VNLARQDRKALEDVGIARVVNLSARDHALPGIVYHRCRVADAEGQDMRPSIASSLDFIEKAHAEGRKVLVHCDHGTRT